MAETEITMPGAKRYYRALLSAYNSLKKPARAKAILTAKKEDLIEIDPLPIIAARAGEDRRALARELSRRIDLLEAKLWKLNPAGDEEQRKMRRLEAKIDIFRSKLDGLRAETS